MKRQIWSKKTVIMIVMMATLVIWGMTGCGSNSDKGSQEAAADSTQEEKEGSEEEGAKQTENIVSTETPMPTQEPAPTEESVPQPAPEEEKVELPEIDERFEYHLCCDDTLIPVIGINNIEGGEWTAVESTIGNGDIYYTTGVSFLKTGESIMTHCSHPDSNPLETNKNTFIPQIILDKEKMATIDTAFGEAEIYWVSTAFQDVNDDHSGSYEIQEIDGKKYWIRFNEIASIPLIDDQIFFTYHYIDMDTYEEGKQYRGVLEEVIPQMLEPK